MNPSLALDIYLVLLVALLYFDPARHPKTSLALWLPSYWIFIAATRPAALWLAGGQGNLASTTAAEAMQEGNPIDRNLCLLVIFLCIAVLVARSFKWGYFISHNWVLMAYLLFALASVMWSDFPLVTFKRWFRDFGNYVAILVILSEPDPLESFRTVFRRLGFALIPLCEVLIKYFPAIGMQFDIWQGTPSCIGPTTSKNMLGLLCMVFGLFFFWDTAERWAKRKDKRTRRIILLNLIYFAMTIWVLNLAHSATSGTCLTIGCVLVLLSHTKVVRRRPGFLKVLAPGSFILYVILAFGLNLNGQLAGAVGRNGTLTDRTLIWRLLLKMHTNPLVGTGYQSFWLGSRLMWFWQTSGLEHINEAHNGYLETYLETGVVGLLLLVVFGWRRYRPGLCRIALQRWA